MMSAPPPKVSTWRSFLLLSLMGAPAAYAQTSGLHGRLALEGAAAFAKAASLGAAAGDETRNDGLADFRVTWEPAWDQWRFALHYVLVGRSSDSLVAARARARQASLPAATWLDLSDHILGEERTSLDQRIDRLSLAYTTEHFVLRVGRQALTWGSGRFFRPMDLLNPFSPSATDTEYKPGTDMVYGQVLFGDGSDLEVVAAPRGSHEGDAPSLNESSVAVHLRKDLFGHQTTWLLARDHGDLVVAAGVNGALGGSTWNVEVAPTFLRQGGTRLSLLANLSTATTLFAHNAALFLEYFHNGFGVGHSAFSIATLPPDLLDRLSRGQVFSRRRNYVAGGLSIEIDPLFSLSPSLIASLDDGSAFAMLAGSYSLSDNLNLILGVQAPIGPANTEFGGVALAPGASQYLAPPTQVYIQLRTYF